MSDKSPRQGMAKKSKSLKEKRADKKAKATGTNDTEMISKAKTR